MLNVRFKSNAQHNDTQYNDAQNNDILCNNTQYNNSKKVALGMTSVREN
jgi:hypothetical protein